MVAVVFVVVASLGVAQALLVPTTISSSSRGGGGHLKATPSPFAFADVVADEAPGDKQPMELAKLATGDLGEAVKKASATLEQLAIKKTATLEQTSAARQRAKEARVDASRFASRAATVQSKTPDTGDILAESEAKAAELRAEEADAKARSSILARFRASDVAEELRLQKTHLSNAERSVKEALADLESLKAKDETVVEKAKMDADRRVKDAENRATFTLDVGVVEPKIAVPVAALAGLLLADFINLHDLDIYLAALTGGAMFVALPDDDALIGAKKSSEAAAK